MADLVDMPDKLSVVCSFKRDNLVDTPDLTKYIETYHGHVHSGST